MNKPKPPVKVPRAHIKSAYDLSRKTYPPAVVYNAVLPCRTRQEARGIVRLRNRTRESLLAEIADIIQGADAVGNPPLSAAFAILKALRLIP